MNLVTRFLAARRDKLLMRLGCWLVCFSLVLGLMLPQQRAEALVAELSMTAVASLAAAYLGACGLSFVTQGMDKDALVNSVQRLIQEFLDTELGGKSIQDWLGNVWDLAVIAGKLIMGRPLTEEFVSFAQWVAGKYAVQVGENTVYSGDGYTISLADSTQYICAGRSYSDILKKYLFSVPLNVTKFSFDTWYDLPSGWKFGYFLRSSFIYQCYLLPSGDEASNPTYMSSYGVSLDGYYLSYNYSSDGVHYMTFFDSSEQSDYVNFSYYCYKNAFTFVSGTLLSVSREDETPVYIPPGIAAEQGIALDVGAAATMDLDQVLQGVLDGVLEGTLTATMEIAEEAVVNPPAGEITDVDNLGLPALGQALTSRFPFSIPWDFFRAVQLLAAPAKAPYFEVDFMEPLADEVGGWQGSTMVVLDFSEYAIIGQISRWTSTIGFCLMLAGATKRLIWTA